MRKAHSKDINRNKSFHPLTFGNLRKVEKLKEEEEALKGKQQERTKELLRDQEERRYEDLVLAASADGQSGMLAQFKQVKNVFAAEYEQDAQQAVEEEAKKKQQQSSASSSAAVAPTYNGAAQKFGSFLDKFKQDSATAVKVEGGNEGTTHAGAEDAVGTKRPRSSTDGSEESSADAPTGYITTAESTRLRKELDLVKKQRVDPLRLVSEHKNKTVAAAARARELQDRSAVQQQQRGNTGKTEGDAIRERLRAVLEMKKNEKK